MGKRAYPLPRRAVRAKKDLYYGSATTGAIARLTPGGGLAAEIATRAARGGDFSALLGRLPNPDPTLRKIGKPMSALKDLLYDTRVGGSVRSLKAGVLKLKSQLTKDGAGANADRVEAALLGLSREKITEDFLEAFLYGYSVSEVVWRFDATPSLTHGLWLPDRVTGKPPHWFSFDKENRLQFHCKEERAGKLVPDRKFIVVQHDADFENPYGRALLSACWWPVVFKKGGLGFWATMAEKFGTPITVINYPRNYEQEEVDELVETATTLVQDGVVAVPEDVQAKIEATGANVTGAVYKDLLAYCDSAIAEVFVGHSGAAESTSGKLGGEDAAIQVRSDILDAAIRAVEAGWNQLIDWIYELNFPAGEPRVRYTLYEEGDVDKATAEVDAILAEKLGVRLTKKAIAKRYNIPEEDFELEEVKPAPAPGLAAPGAPGATPETPALSILKGSAPGGPNAPAGGRSALSILRGDHGAPDECCGDHAEGEELPEDQTAVDALVDEAQGSANAQVNEALESLFSDLLASNDYEEAKAIIAKALPGMETGKLQKALARGTFIAETIGRLSADGENQA
jgi:phage gp29-like protein